MMSWWEMERLAELRVQDRMREAGRERRIRQARGADSRRTGLLSLVAAWLNGRFSAVMGRQQEPCCTAVRLDQSQPEPHGSLIL
jgi:hypothetical protein